MCYKIRNNSEEITATLSGFLLDYFKTGKIAVVKPYLRPMSSMTEEEKIEWDAEYAYNSRTYSYEGYVGKMTDWLNKHHFDYRGLIEKGLALEAPKDMY